MLNLSRAVERLRFGPKLMTTSAPLEKTLVHQRENRPFHYHYDTKVTEVDLIIDG
jgi:hypothetical protein